jgi:Alpha/beta hydrolase domain containing 18
VRNWYERFITNWENRLCSRATNRVVRDFEWGLDWTHEWPTSRILPRNGHAPYDYLRELNEIAIGNSDEFFAYTTPSDFELRDAILRFTSPVRTPYPENNVVHGQWFPAKASKKAVVILPHWNAPGGGHNAIGRGLQKLGISALRISLPYHDFRMPPELQRADYAVSSNVGRTLDASRQAVIDVRCCFDWLERQGYERLGIVGTSLGSCYACLAAAHDARIRVNVFNHCATYFADVVWTGLSTQHIRKGLEGNIDLGRLRECWMAISPVNYLEKFARNGSKALFIYTSYDTTFLPEFSTDIVSKIAQHGVDHKVVVLPCGHYTLGETPFKFIDGYHICAYLKRML